MKTIGNVKHKVGLFLFAGGVGALFVAASTSVSGNGLIRGRVIIDRPGTYTVGQDIDLSADSNASAIITITSGGVVLDLDGHQLTGPSGSAVIEVAPVTNVDDLVTVRDGAVIGGSVGTHATSGHLRYEHMTLRDQVTYGVDGAALDVDITHTVIRNSGASAVHLSMGQPVQDWLISDSVINGSGGNAIDAHGQGALRVERTTVRNAGGCALMIANDSTTGDIGAGLTVIDSNALATGRDGWHVVGRMPVTIQGGRLRNITRNGLYVNGSDQPVAVVDVAAQIDDHGFLVTGGGTTTITGNRLRLRDSNDAASVAVGIEIDGTGGPAVSEISGNTILGGGSASAAGIVLRAGTTAQVRDNVINGGGVGVLTQAKDTLVEDNQLRNVHGAGVIAEDKGVVVRRNTIRGFVGVGDSLTAGVWAGAGAEAGLIEDNVIRGFSLGLKIDGLDVPCVYRKNLLACNTTSASGGTDGGGNFADIFGTCTE